MGEPGAKNLRSNMETRPSNDSNEDGASTGSENKMVESTDEKGATTLSPKQRKDIFFSVLAFSCVVATLTLVVGTGGVVLLSVGGSPSLAPSAVGVVFLGMSWISLTATHWIFSLWGRQKGFLVGCFLGLVGVLIGCGGLLKKSPTIVLVGQAIIGSGIGIGMYLRFSAMEVVPPSFASRAVSWVLGGGCLAAFVGPEVSQATTGLFGKENGDDDAHLTYLGTFIVAGGFFLLQSFFVGLVGFPPPPTPDGKPNLSNTKDGDDQEPNNEVVELSDEEAVSSQEERAAVHQEMSETTTLWSIVSQALFLLPLGVAILSWIMMSMPMSMFRIAMSELGFTSRQSLTVIEFHFLGMYGPGFFSGRIIQRHGTLRACWVGWVCFLISLGVHMTIQDNNRSTAAWFVGLILVGIGWNFGYSSATVWSAQSYAHDENLKPKLQAANECITFLVSGAVLFSTGYIYEDAGGGGLDGWRFLNAILFAFAGLYALLLLISPFLLERTG